MSISLDSSIAAVKDAAEKLQLAKFERDHAMLEALRDGASYQEVANAAGLSRSGVQGAVRRLKS